MTTFRAQDDSASHDGAAPLLLVRDLVTSFRDREGVDRRAVDGVSLELKAGTSLGLVGESGCGKTTLGRTILRLTPAASGSIEFDGIDVRAARGGSLRRLRRDMQIVFQDPGGSLNPAQRVWRTVSEPEVVHGSLHGRARRRARAGELMERCGLDASLLDRYPHQFSGGQRQRLSLARALSTTPKLVVCDEPTSALDVSVQAQVLNLLKDLQREFGLAYLFISHDLAVVAHLCPRVAVMLNGRLVEEGQTEQVLREPQHEFTRRLFQSVEPAGCA